MSVDVDAVNERLNGLVTLLKAVGVDSLGDNSNMKKGGPGSIGGLGNPQQLDDDQIEAIIKKLQQAQAEAPQIIAALEAHAEARSLTGSQAKSSRKQKPEPEPEPEEEEDDDEFDEDANYPMVGHGVSDDISVVSDLTTPTVVQGVQVPDEEHYRDTLPPMIIGGGHDAPAMIIAAPKKKNLVGQVSAGGAARRMPQQQRGRGGAAAARRNKYQNTMEKLGESHDEHHAPKRSSKAKRPPNGQVRKKKSAPSHSELGAPRQNDFAMDSWNTFENKPRVPNKAPTMIDNDGFLTSDGFDPFGSDNPFKSSAGDLEFGGRFSSNASASGFESFEGGKANPRRVKKKAPSMQSNFSSAPERKVRPSGHGGPSNGRRPRARRASLAM